MVSPSGRVLQDGPVVVGRQVGLGWAATFRPLHCNAALTDRVFCPPRPHCTNSYRSPDPRRGCVWRRESLRVEGREGEALGSQDQRAFGRDAGGLARSLSLSLDLRPRLLRTGKEVATRAAGESPQHTPAVPVPRLGLPASGAVGRELPTA